MTGEAFISAAPAFFASLLELVASVLMLPPFIYFIALFLCAYVIRLLRDLIHIND